MKQGILLLAFSALALTAASAASARVSVNIGIDPFGYGAYPAPPVVYQPAPYYAPPPVVYLGGGSWGGDHRDHGGHGRPPARGHDAGRHR